MAAAKTRRTHTPLNCFAKPNPIEAVVVDVVEGGTETIDDETID